MSATNENQVRAARVRALVMSRLTGVPQTTAMLFKALEKEMQDMGVDYKNFSSLLGAARRNGLVASEREGLTYNHWKGEVEDDEPPNVRPAKNSAKGKADISITVIKATKVVRLTVNGLIIDIGVE